MSGVRGGFSRLINMHGLNHTLLRDVRINGDLRKGATGLVR